MDMRTDRFLPTDFFVCQCPPIVAVACKMLLELAVGIGGLVACGCASRCWTSTAFGGASIRVGKYTLVYSVFDGDRQASLSKKNGRPSGVARFFVQILHEVCNAFVM